ncbi:hypothetical protein Asp14428_78510 [Actinoplanes sp. NBRC 14428]|nr:hypothetical protein Asp14428_78510 [Actinoplanes sp. NBRC 14428]
MSLTLGVGVRAAVTPGQLGAAVDASLSRAGVPGSAVSAVATLDRRAPVLAPFARARGWPLVPVPPELLAAVVPARPSPRVAALAGVPSVAEAAALAAAGPGAALILPKQVFPGVTVAIARAV